MPGPEDEDVDQDVMEEPDQCDRASTAMKLIPKTEQAAAAFQDERVVEVALLMPD